MKLNLKKVKEIRAMKAQGMFTSDIAKKYKVSKSTVLNVLKRKTWKWVKD